jgi:Icc-related predicted phosphoesterase
MRVATVADLHGRLPAVPECDLLLIAGDLGPQDVDAEEAFLRGPFRGWLDEAPAKEIVAVAGNHDFLFEREPGRIPSDLRWTYLEDGACEAAGLTIWGSPWTPWFFDWAFNAPRSGGEAFLAERYAAVPDAADVLLIHGPPAGYGDTTTKGMGVGSTAELELIDRVAPRLCVFGHIHEGRGTWQRAGTTLVNCAAVDVAYELVADPVVVLDL